ncbi:MAG TPA: glycoside hydrolase family 130 protein [Candidatus Sumerlaeota bacterium]|nr:MAG: Beta-1,4-mannooligosaccharide phosphorylase [candidate division BRC1 bacterium ADurb.BinA292]HOE95394.1 glycoside hydrolase family 130 protein [Candidatus Sumerlaeota bacterium]HOR27059.1 glycoside hydrolase family 130 protein [Candidatus Sumerlaeota bacterium]HPK01606.1 glycoside hydrolase family 130 protein [Candidatus Sumerlaeota bacterium]
MSVATEAAPRQGLIGAESLLKRYPGNPIIPRNALPDSDSILNSAVVRFGDAYRGMFRVDNQNRDMLIHPGRSADGLHWEIDPRPVQWQCRDSELEQIVYAYDPRITPLEGRYYITWCHGYHGPCIAMGVTDDFEKFELLEVVLPPFNRNAVLFPRKINGRYVMLHRPSDNGHTPFGDIFLSQSPDLIHWGSHRFVMGTAGGWQSTKIGAGPVPIETDEGWVMIYHGVLTSCNGFVYSVGCAILDLDQPWKVLHRTRRYILAPTEPYEMVGSVPNVTFPVACIHEEKTDELRVYYGAADTSVCLATTTLRELIDFTKEHDMLKS